MISHPLGIHSGNSRIWADFAQASLSTDWFLPSTTAARQSPRESPLVNIADHSANSPREAKRTERMSANSTSRKVCSRFYAFSDNRGSTTKSTTRPVERTGFSTSIGDDDENRSSGRHSSSYVASPRESYLPRGEPRGTEAKQALISDKKLLFFVGQIAELDNRDFLLPLPRTAGIRPYRHQGFHQRGEFVAGKRNSTNRAQNVV